MEINNVSKEIKHHFFIGFIVLYFLVNFLSKYVDPYNQYRFTSVVNLTFEILIVFFL